MKKVDVAPCIMVEVYRLSAVFPASIIRTIISLKHRKTFNRLHAAPSQESRLNELFVSQFVCQELEGGASRRRVCVCVAENSEQKCRLFVRYQMLLPPGRKVEQYFMFRHLVFISLFGLCGLVYNFSDPVASGSPGTLTVRIAAKCFRMILDRTFRLPLEGES